jgi:hypothetical protein
MSHKQPNADIRCNVSSCAFHCTDQDFCSLRSIKVEACRNSCTGKPEDESMCGSYERQ